MALDKLARYAEEHHGKKQKMIRFVFNELPNSQFIKVIPKSERDIAATSLRDDLKSFESFVFSFYAFCKPINEFSTWITGCDCHEKQRLAGKRSHFTCPFQGCRAPGLSQKVQLMIQCAERSRDNLKAADHPMMYTSLFSVFNRVIYLAKLRFNWVDSEPYTVWKVIGFQSIFLQYFNKPGPGKPLNIT